MLKKVFLLFVLTFVFYLISCTPNSSDNPTILPTQDLSIVKNWICENTITETDKDVILPQREDVSITWKSLTPLIIKDDGKLGVLNKKIINKGLMEYTISSNGETITGEIAIDIYPRTLDTIALEFFDQFGDSISDDLNIGTEFYNMYTVTWSSSNNEVFSDLGVYSKPLSDTKIVIHAKVVATPNLYEEFDKEIIVDKYTDTEVYAKSLAYINDIIFKDSYITKDIELPTYLDEYGCNLTWKSSDESVITSDGKITRYVYDRYLDLSCLLSFDNYQIEISYPVVVARLDLFSLNASFILSNFVSSITVDSIDRVVFKAYSDISQSFNMLYLYNNIPVNRIEHITESSQNRPRIIKTSTELIVVHDTANTNKDATAHVHANYVENGGGGTSYHYVVGNDGIYHLIPDNEVAYHAGDGRRLFNLIDTGIKATSMIPQISISERYFTINNEKTNIKIPDEAPNNAQICSSGIYFEIGENGNYFLNDNYWNTDYHYIANKGGNRNSIGIETCVNMYSNYFKTIRLNASLVALLLDENNLDVSRVLQHNNMSGKNCPNAMRTADYWSKFKDYVSLELFARQYLKDYSFEWTSNTTIMDNEGYISLNLNDNSVLSYSLKVIKDSSIVYDNEFVTSINK